MKNSLFFLITAVIFIPGLPINSHAHKINVFAYVENQTIFCEAVFSGGRPAQKAPVQIMDTKTRATLATGKTDTNGHYNIAVSSIKNSRNSIEVIVQTDDGHRNSWTLAPKDYLDNTIHQPPHSGTEQNSPDAVPIKNIILGLFCIFSIAGGVHLLSSKKRKRQ